MFSRQLAHMDESTCRDMNTVSQDLIQQLNQHNNNNNNNSSDFSYEPGDSVPDDHEHSKKVCLSTSNLHQELLLLPDDIIDAGTPNPTTTSVDIIINVPNAAPTTESDRAAASLITKADAASGVLVTTADQIPTSSSSSPSKTPSSSSSSNSSSSSSSGGDHHGECSTSSAERAASGSERKHKAEAQPEVVPSCSNEQQRAPPGPPGAHARLQPRPPRRFSQIIEILVPMDGFGRCQNGSVACFVMVFCSDAINLDEREQHTKAVFDRFLAEGGSVAAVSERRLPNSRVLTKFLLKTVNSNLDAVIQGVGQCLS